MRYRGERERERGMIMKYPVGGTVILTENGICVYKERKRNRICEAQCIAGRIDAYYGCLLFIKKGSNKGYMLKY